MAVAGGTTDGTGTDGDLGKSSLAVKVAGRGVDVAHAVAEGPTDRGGLVLSKGVAHRTGTGRKRQVRGGHINVSQDSVVDDIDVVMVVIAIVGAVVDSPPLVAALAPAIALP